MTNLLMRGFMIATTNKRYRRLATIALLLFALLLAATVAQASVGLTHFDATPGPGAAQITITWGTETELDVVAFRVVRSTQPLVQTAIQVHVTPAVGSGVGGAEYDFVDSGLVAGQRYFYWLYQITAAGDVYLISQAATAVAPAQSTLTRRTYLPLAFRSN